jgi:hypothetical protein
MSAIAIYGQAVLGSAIETIEVELAANGTPQLDSVSIQSNDFWLVAKDHTTSHCTLVEWHTPAMWLGPWSHEGQTITACHDTV